MIRKQLLIGILAAMTVALPAVGIYAGSAEASEIQSSNEDTVSGNKGASIDKAVTLQNSVKMTDQISAAVNGENAAVRMDVRQGQMIERGRNVRRDRKAAEACRLQTEHPLDHNLAV